MLHHMMISGWNKQTHSQTPVMLVRARIPVRRARPDVLRLRAGDVLLFLLGNVLDADIRLSLRGGAHRLLSLVLQRRIRISCPRHVRLTVACQAQCVVEAPSSQRGGCNVRSPCALCLTWRVLRPGSPNDKKINAPGMNGRKGGRGKGIK
jgi:hypothetical protein